MSVFNFKQFSVNQDNCAMKVGTDGVLLGAWSSIDHFPNSVLDIGSGTGLIALMIAQRSNAEIIDALEIDEQAYEQCVENFENSFWSDRLFCYHASLNEFTNEIEDKYDLIVSNPPFYSNTYKSNNVKRDLARFEDAMPFNELVQCTSQLLSQKGKFNVVIPYNSETHFLKIADQKKLFPNKILRVKGTPNSEIKRSLIELSFVKKDVKINELILELKRHIYSQDYINLTKEFYLKM